MSSMPMPPTGQPLPAGPLSGSVPSAPGSPTSAGTPDPLGSQGPTPLGGAYPAAQNPQLPGVQSPGAPYSPDLSVAPAPGGPRPPQFPPPQGSGFAPSENRPPTLQKITSETSATSIPGLLGLVIDILLIVGGIVLIAVGSAPSSDPVDPYSYGGPGNSALIVVGVVLLVIACFLWTALVIVQPGDTKVVQFFGNYIGTIRATGLRMTFPFTSRRKVSVKVRNFETREIKVNDALGNPIVIGAIIVWQVADTAQATFQVENYEEFVMVQSEAALRHIATVHPYDNAEDGEQTLRGSTDLVAAELAAEVRDRVSVAGVNILETRISSLSYAPEIASAMLQRQQAEAILAARSKIVEGAVSMVESALKRIEDEEIVVLDEERKAAMISNLLVVLCSDSRATPTINTGSLYT